MFTGGHEENLRLQAINLNHGNQTFVVYNFKGPDGCYWFGIDVKYAKQFRKLVQETQGIDIHKDEGLWFADIDFCIRNGIEISYFVQEAGDIVNYY